MEEIIIDSELPNEFDAGDRIEEVARIGMLAAENWLSRLNQVGGRFC